MAMQAPPQADDSEEEGGIFAEVNITPLTDIVFVLLIIFMVSSSAMVDAAREGRLEVDLPQAGSGAPEGQEPKLLIISVLKDGRVAIEEQVVSDEELLTTLQERQQKAPKSMALIDADGAVEHKKVVRVLDLLRQAGFANVGIGVAAGQ